MCPMICLTRLTSRAYEIECREPQEFFSARVLLLYRATCFAVSSTSQAFGTISSVPLPGCLWALQKGKCCKNEVCAHAE